MKIKPKDSEKDQAISARLRARLGEQNLMDMFTTLLGVADQIGRYIIETRQAGNSPFQVRYSLIQLYSMLAACSKALNTEEPIKVGGYFPTGGESWKSEEDFEKRLILLIKLYNEQLKKEGKL